MADYLARVRDLLLAEVQRDPDRYMTRGSKGRPRRPNASALARAMGVRPSTVHRILYGNGFGSPGLPYRPGQDVMDGLMRLLDLPDEGEVWRRLTAPSVIQSRRL
jgi:hypothetical protein